MGIYGLVVTSYNLVLCGHNDHLIFLQEWVCVYGKTNQRMIITNYTYQHYTYLVKEKNDRYALNQRR
jgi:hypothetical protein